MGVTENYQKAFECYEKAALQGDAKAQHNLGVMYYNGDGVTKDIKKAFEWYEKAAIQGLADAQNKLSIMYFLGVGVVENYIEAYKWVLLAGSQDIDVSDLKKSIREEMTKEQIVEAQMLAQKFVEEMEKSKSKENEASQRE